MNSSELFSIMNNNSNSVRGMSTGEKLKEAIECMIEGTAQTGECTAIWGRREDIGPMGPGTVGLFQHLKNDPEKPPDDTCAEGALVYGAWLRGWKFNEAITLLTCLQDHFYEKYLCPIYAVNDNVKDNPQLSGGRDEAVKLAKELQTSETATKL